MQRGASRSAIVAACVLTLSACAKKPTAEDIPFDASRGCSDGLLTMHYPKSFHVTDAEGGICVVTPDAASGFSPAVQLLVSAVKGDPKLPLEITVDSVTKFYAARPGWKQKSLEVKKCLGDLEGMELVGTMDDGTTALELAICTFRRGGDVIQITTSTNAVGTDAVLAKRLAAAVELGASASPASTSAAPSASAK